MLPNRETLLCSYRYDPLDRLVDCTPSAQSPTRRFYLKDRLATEIQDAVQRSIMQHEDQLLAHQQRQSGVVDTRLLATDKQRSVLNVLDATRLNPLAYSPYGHRPAESGLLSLLGFNGERPDPVTGWYLLGNGYRAFNPVLMRFNSPDSWSPFGEGGVNGYAYCAGDPVNRQDSTGHIPLFPKGYNPFKGFGNRLGLRTPARQSLLPGRESTSSGSNASFATEVARAQEKDQIIASQRSTIESQQKTIAFQQKNLDSAQSTIELGKAVVRDYKSALTQQEALIFKLRTKISELQTDLEFSVHTNPNSDRTTADIATAYGSHSPPQPRSGVLPNHIPHNNTTIRSM